MRLWLVLLLLMTAPVMAQDVVYSSALEEKPAATGKVWHDGKGKKTGASTKVYRPVPKEGSADGKVYCENTGAQRTVHVNIASLPPQYIETFTSRDITALTSSGLTKEELLAQAKAAGMADDPRRQYLEHSVNNHKEYNSVAGLTKSTTSFIYVPNIIIKGVNRSAGCMFIDNVSLQVEQNFTIYLASEYRQNLCMRAEILEHEELHVEAHKQIWDRHEKALYDLLKGYVDAYRPVRLYESDYKAEGERINKEMTDIIRKKLEDIQQEDVKMQMQIDSNGAYDYLNKLACKDSAGRD